MDAQLLVFIKFILAFFSSAIVSSQICKALIKQFKKNRIGSVEREFTTNNHQIKKGTPTMGGLSFICTTLLAFTIFNFGWWNNKSLLAILICYSGFFLIGLLDDYSKIKRVGYDGIKGIYRIIAEIVIGIFVLLILGDGFQIISLVKLNFITPISILVACVVVLILLIVGSANAMNLSDGLDGLASGLFMMALAPFILIFITEKNYSLALLLTIQVGALSGFLIHNFYPAKLFMGDCGSLPLGALLGVSAIVSGNVLLLSISAGLIMIEAISVIIQVIVFQLTRKRVFLMTPLHHHFELKGWKEERIIMLFWIIGFILSLIGCMIGVI